MNGTYCGQCETEWQTRGAVPVECREGLCEPAGFTVPAGRAGTAHDDDAEGWERWAGAAADVEREWAIGNDDAARRYIEHLVLEAHAAQWRLDCAIGMAKDAGWSWLTIARVVSGLGFVEFRLASKQAAARRFAGAVETYGRLLDNSIENDDARATFATIARGMTARPARGWFEVRTSKRPREGRLLSRHRKVERAKTAAGLHGYVFECSPRQNEAPRLVWDASVDNT